MAKDSKAVEISLERGASAALPFYSVSTGKFLILSLTTLGIYPQYWFYKNWKCIRENTGVAMRPFWRAFFSPLYCHPLVTTVNSAAESLHLAGKLQPVLITGGYIGILALWRLPDPWWMVSLLAFLPLLPVQRRIQEIHEAIQPGRAMPVGWRLRSVLAASIGGVLTLFSMSGVFGPPTKALPGSELPASYADRLVEAGIVEADEEIEYFYSAGLFSILEDGNLFTDRRVVSYEKQDGELQIASADYDQIENIHVSYSTNALENSTVSVSTQDGDEFLLLVSAEEGRDKEFVAQLEQHLNGSQLEGGDEGEDEGESL